MQNLSQLMRAALSVILNIVEGSAKRTEAERKRFYNIAYASSKEVQAILNLLKLTQEQNLADKASACLYRLHNRGPLPDCLTPQSLHNLS